MALFHVYVEGPVDPTPQAAAKLAEVMASRYGLTAADVTARLAKGRFRVKANVDRATADVYEKDLRAVGAKVKIEEARAQTSPSIQPATARTPTPPAGTPQRKSQPSLASGLAAAFSPSGSQDLGALAQDSGSFALSSVDGNEAVGHGEDAFGPPGAGLPASIGPSGMDLATPTKAPPPRRTTPPPMDAFRPPDADDDDQRVEIAADEIAAKEARKRASAPPPNVPATPVLQRKQSTSIQPQSVPVTSVATVRGRLGPLSDVRIRFAAGVFAAVLVGFVPTHVIAGMRETTAYKAIDSKFITDASVATDPTAWAALDEPALRDKKAAQKSILWTSLLLWALCSAGLGYVWFKRLPWDAWDRPKDA
jgi:hypothetical protein